MKYWVSLVFSVLLLGAPTLAGAEAWHYVCAEAITLLKHSQDQVARRHEYLRQAKLALKLLPKELETCRTGEQGFEGGSLYCVRHRSQGWSGMKEVILAERALDKAMEIFNEHRRVFTQACRSEP